MAQVYTTSHAWDECSWACEPCTAVVTPWRSAQSPQRDPGQVEPGLATAGRALRRRLCQGHLEYRAAHATDGESVAGSDDLIRGPHRPGGSPHLATLCGAGTGTRQSYGARGVHRLFPWDAALHLPPETDADGLRCHGAPDGAILSFAEATARMAQTTGGPIPTRHREQRAVQVAHACAGCDGMRHAHAAAASAALLLLTTEGQGIVRRPADRREAPRHAAERAGPTRPARLSPGETRQRKRLAPVASISTVAPSVRRPEAVMSPDGAARPRPTGHTKRGWRVGSARPRRSSPPASQKPDGVTRLGNGPGWPEAMARPRHWRASKPLPPAIGRR